MGLLTKGRIVLVAGALAAVSAAFIGFSDRSPGAGITAANYDRIAEGMTDEEVTTILGCPPGDYTDDGWCRGLCDMGVVGQRRERWMGRTVMIELVFVEADGHLADKSLLKRPRTFSLFPFNP
jgi:hypothetical protein